MKLRPIRYSDRATVEAALNRYIGILAPGMRRLDADPFFYAPDNFGYMTLDYRALALFSADVDFTYQAHLLCESPYRGKRAVEFGRAAVAALFTRRDAPAITAEIPRENKHSRLVCRAIGGTPFADSVDCFDRPCIRYILTRATWEASLAESPRA